MTSATSGAAAGTYTFPSKPALWGDTIFYVHSQELAINTTYLNTKSGNINDVNGMFSIPVTVPYGAVQNYEPNDHDRIVWGRQGRSAKNFTITLRTNHGRLLSLSDNDEAVLVLKVIYSPS